MPLFVIFCFLSWTPSPSVNVSLNLWEPSCWPGPYTVISLWSAWAYQVHPFNSILVSIFAKSASFHNPVIYIGMCSKFRKDLQALAASFAAWGPSAAQSTSPRRIDWRCAALSGLLYGGSTRERVIMEMPVTVPKRRTTRQVMKVPISQPFLKNRRNSESLWTSFFQDHTTAYK